MASLCEPLRRHGGCTEKCSGETFFVSPVCVRVLPDPLAGCPHPVEQCKHTCQYAPGSGANWQNDMEHWQPLPLSPSGARMGGTAPLRPTQLFLSVPRVPLATLRLPSPCNVDTKADFESCRSLLLEASCKQRLEAHSDDGSVGDASGGEVVPAPRVNPGSVAAAARRGALNTSELSSMQRLQQLETPWAVGKSAADVTAAGVTPSHVDLVDLVAMARLQALETPWRTLVTVQHFDSDMRVSGAVEQAHDSAGVHLSSPVGGSGHASDGDAVQAVAADAAASRGAPAVTPAACTGGAVAHAGGSTGDGRGWRRGSWCEGGVGVAVGVVHLCCRVGGCVARLHPCGTSAVAVPAVRHAAAAGHGDAMGGVGACS